MRQSLPEAQGLNQLALAVQVERLADELWAGRKPTAIIGRAASLAAALERVARFAPSSSPVLLTGETGTGKELFARAIHVLSPACRRPFLSVNCAQYHDGQLIASELFGHRRGSFTGAVSDHRGVFEEADGGVVFLDEIGELSLTAQAMLLRTLSEGEIVPVGDTRPRAVNVRVIAATSRDLPAMISAGIFRPDLYYRLRYLHAHIPPVRERGDDWEIISEHFLSQLGRMHSRTKMFGSDAIDLMSTYHWPGNVRELKSIVDMGFYLSDGAIIEAQHFIHELEVAARHEQLHRIPVVRDDGRDPFQRMVDGGESFWDVIHAPYMRRELSRAEALGIISKGLDQTRGSYKRLLPLFHMADNDYLKFMDFLRHQRLKPN